MLFSTAGMRGLSVFMGLIGTAVMPFMERRMGLVRGGAWSLWCVVPPYFRRWMAETDEFLR